MTPPSKTEKGRPLHSHPAAAAMRMSRSPFLFLTSTYSSPSSVWPMLPCRSNRPTYSTHHHPDLSCPYLCSKPMLQKTIGVKSLGCISLSQASHHADCRIVIDFLQRVGIIQILLQFQKRAGSYRSGRGISLHIIHL